MSNEIGDLPQLSRVQEIARRRWQNSMRQRAPGLLRDLQRILGISLPCEDILGYEEFATLQKAFDHELSRQPEDETLRTTPMDEEEPLSSWITELIPAVEDLPVILFFTIGSGGGEMGSIDGAIRVPAGPVLWEMGPVWERFGYFALCTEDAEDGLDAIEDWLHKELRMRSWGRLSLPDT